MQPLKQAALILALVMMAGCKTHEKIVTVERVRIDTTYITRQQRDSIFVHDSTNVRERQKGDTIFVEVERLKRIFHENTVHDTIREATHDSIPVPYPVEVEVEKKLSKWQQFRLQLGNIVLGGLGLLAVGWFVKRRFW